MAAGKMRTVQGVDGLVAADHPGASLRHQRHDGGAEAPPAPVTTTVLPSNSALETTLAVLPES